MKFSKARKADSDDVYRVLLLIGFMLVIIAFTTALIFRDLEMLVK
ncbi:MAG TPA: hypothetical protein VI875_04370 [Candidatus Norongarragalinales archaeon]|nr:hypothetical protein [Candidatus Norongarragalinales archaeon]